MFKQNLTFITLVKDSCKIAFPYLNKKRYIENSGANTTITKHNYLILKELN